MTRAARLPDGRWFRLDDVLGDRASCGLLVAAGLRGGDGASLPAEVAALEARLRARYAGAPPTSVPGLAEARELYRAFGMEPSRHRPSSEALLRRVLQGKGLYRLGCAVDACNLASLTFLLPIGLYDLGRVRGDVSLTVGRPGESYAGIRKDDVNVGGRLCLRDEDGPFGSPTSDSLRTSVGDQAGEVLAVVMATGAYRAVEMNRHLDLLADLFRRHCGAREAWQAVLVPAEATT